MGQRSSTVPPPTPLPPIAIAPAIPIVPATLLVPAVLFVPPVLCVPPVDLPALLPPWLLVPPDDVPPSSPVPSPTSLAPPHAIAKITKLKELRAFVMSLFRSRTRASADNVGQCHMGRREKARKNP
jgi:hypothetical protein